MRTIGLALLWPILSFILICEKITYTCTPGWRKKWTVTKKEDFTRSQTRALTCVCVYSMNFPLSQQGLNTHRVNIIGLNRGRVDIGLVWAQDFIFLSLTLVFAGCNLNSIGVICLSKGKTGTRRSWVCAHRNQGNSIRWHSYCVWGQDSSVAMGGNKVGWLYIGGLHHLNTEFTMVVGRPHRWMLLRMHHLHISAAL